MRNSCCLYLSDSRMIHTPSSPLTSQRSISTLICTGPTRFTWISGMWATRLTRTLFCCPQEAVLAEVKQDLTTEEAFEGKKNQLAELGMALLSDPESNIKSSKEILQICKDNNHAIVKLGLLSLLAVFKDIIPGALKLGMMRGIRRGRHKRERGQSCLEEPMGMVLML